MMGSMQTLWISISDSLKRDICQLESYIGVGSPMREYAICKLSLASAGSAG